MIEHARNRGLDETDLALLEALQADGRSSIAELARRINLSQPATHARLQRLTNGGYVIAYTAVLDREKLGFDLLCFIEVSIQRHQPEWVERFREAVRRMPEVLECHHVTGEYDYLLKVVVRNRKDLERFVVGRLTPVPGIARIHTSVALSEVKATTALPLS